MAFSNDFRENRRIGLRDNKGRILPGLVPIEERFWAKVDKNGPLWNGTPCWVWLASRNPLGYGKIGIGRKLEHAHIIAYRLLIGEIPTGLEIDHLCRNPACVNPAHLQAVSHRDNELRGKAPCAQHARKTHCPQGHPYDLFNTYFYQAKNHNYPARLCLTCRQERIKIWNEKVRLAPILGRPLHQELPRKTE